MTREEAKELLPIIQAWADGKTVDWYDPDIGWRASGFELDFDKNPKYFRIKSEPESKYRKYRPFKTQEECWNEMHKHPDFGWVKKIDGGYKQIMAIHIDIFNKYCADFAGQTGTACFEFEYIYKNYTFTDGIPFGIKEE